MTHFNGPSDPRLQAIAEAERAKYRKTRVKPNPPQENGEDDDPIIIKRAQAGAISDIPPRQWAYGNFLLFGEAGVIGAADGGGKGAMAVVIALSFIIGRALLGERVWRTGPVAVLTYEDDETEWRRRIAAACLHYGIDYESVIGSFYFITKLSRRVSLASRGPDGTVLLPDGDQIIHALKEIGAVLLIVDPLNHAHELNDGNNNVLIAMVAHEIGRITKQSTAAGLVLHHLRKSSTGDPDDLMGATSLRATFRAGARILVRMKEEEANRLQVPKRQAFRYSRIAGTKENYAPPPERASWYRLESIALGNPDELYIDGDNVQVTTTWIPPSAFADVQLTEIADIFARLRQPPGEGLRWSPDRRSDEWVGNPIGDVTGADDDAAARIIDGWRDTATLIEDTYRHPKSRQIRKCVSLNEVKAAEILGPLYPKSEE